MNMKSGCSLASVLMVLVAGTIAGPAATADGEQELSFIGSMRDAVRDPIELEPFARGSAHVRVNSIQGGTQYEVSVDAPNVVGVRIEEPGTGLTYVAISVVERIGQPTSRRAEANVAVTSEFVNGAQAVRVKSATPDNLSLIFESADGAEALWVLTSTDGLDGTELVLTFDPSRDQSRGYVLDCNGTRCVRAN